MYVTMSRISKYHISHYHIVSSVMEKSIVWLKELECRVNTYYVLELSFAPPT